MYLCKYKFAIAFEMPSIDLGQPVLFVLLNIQVFFGLDLGDSLKYLGYLKLLFSKIILLSNNAMF